MSRFQVRRRNDMSLRCIMPIISNEPKQRGHSCLRRTKKENIILLLPRRPLPRVYRIMAPSSMFAPWSANHGMRRGARGTPKRRMHTQTTPFKCLPLGRGRELQRFLWFHDQHQRWMQRIALSRSTMGSRGMVPDTSATRRKRAAPRVSFRNGVSSLRPLNVITVVPLP